MIKADVSVEVLVGARMKAEEPCWSTPSNEPSLTAAAVPLDIAVEMADPLSGGRIRASRRTPGDAMKASLAAGTSGKDIEEGLTSSVGTDG